MCGCGEEEAHGAVPNQAGVRYTETSDGARALVTSRTCAIAAVNAALECRSIGDRGTVGWDSIAPTTAAALPLAGTGPEPALAPPPPPPVAFIGAIPRGT